MAEQLFALPDLDELFPGTSGSLLGMRAQGTTCVRACVHEEEDPVLALQMQLLESESEVIALRSQLDKQHAFVVELQASLVHLSMQSAEAPSAWRGWRRRRDGGQAPGPLVDAARAGRRETLELLLDAAHERGDPVPTHALDSTLLAACEAGHVSAAELMLQRGADVHADHDSALIWACSIGDTSLVSLLLSNGADVEALDGCPLRVAARMERAGVVRILVEHGAHVA
jgi:hypothetical protein